MFDRVRLRTMPFDDVADTRSKYVGLLSERIATTRLTLNAMLAGDFRQSDVERVRDDLAALELQLEQARKPSWPKGPLGKSAEGDGKSSVSESSNRPRVQSR